MKPSLKLKQSGFDLLNRSDGVLEPIFSAQCEDAGPRCSLTPSDSTHRIEL
jgi:hypothetical protein